MESSEALVVQGHGPVIELGTLSASTGAGLLEAAASLATPLKALIESRDLSSNINGRPYVKCEGWTAMAAMLGITPHEVAVTESDGVYTAVVELRRLKDGQSIARASAECGAPDELDRWGKPIWSSRPRYARRSMALTRATAKACRLAFSWIIVLAGYEATPEEEMPKDAVAVVEVPRPHQDAAVTVVEMPRAPVTAPPKAPPTPGMPVLRVKEVQKRTGKSGKEYYEVYFQSNLGTSDKNMATTFDEDTVEVAIQAIHRRLPVQAQLLQKENGYWNLKKLTLLDED